MVELEEECITVTYGLSKAWSTACAAGLEETRGLFALHSWNKSGADGR